MQAAKWLECVTGYSMARDSGDDNFDDRKQDDDDDSALSPEDGLRIIEALRKIRNPTMRRALIDFVEALAMGQS